MLLISLFLYVQQASVAWQFTLPNFVPKPYFSDLIVNCVHDFLGAWSLLSYLKEMKKNES